MGRHQFFVLGIVLLVFDHAQALRGQEAVARRPSASRMGSTPAELEPPGSPGSPLNETSSGADPKGVDPDDLARLKSGPAPEDGNTSSSRSQPKASPDDPAGGLVDPSVRRTQGSSPAQAQAVAGGVGSPTGSSPPGSGSGSSEPETARPASERLFLRKQAVTVTVDVQAPTNMNLNQEATIKLIVRNTGADDAFNVKILDELPDGLKFVSSVPEGRKVDEAQYTWGIAILQAGSEKVFTLKVKPTISGPFEHAAFVTFVTGSKSRTTVVEPKLKVDLVVNPTTGKVLKGQPVEFKVAVTNTGTGPARGVSIKAMLSPGLRKESEDREYELTLPDLQPNQTETLDPLIADAYVKGEQFCTVVAKSPDVVFNKDEAESTKTIAVVAPELKIALTAPESRYTDTIADYEIKVENTGTAPARKVRVLTTLPVSGRLMKVPPGADFDKATRKLQWKLDVIDAGKSQNFAFQVKMAGSGDYQCITEAAAEGAPKAKDERHTDVIGMAVVELDVSEPKRVVDVDGTTTFQIRLTNSGTKDATHLAVTANLSKNLKAVAAGGVPKEIESMVSPTGDVVEFLKIDKLAKEKEIVLGIKVKVLDANPRLATCRVSVKYDDMPEPIDDMAGFKVTTTRRTAAAPTTIKP